MTQSTEKLGRTQRKMLRALVDHGRWSPGCGWIWTNHSTTVRLLDSLVARGMAERTTRASGEPVYIPTVRGRQWDEGTAVL